MTIGYWNERSAKLLPSGEVTIVGRPYRAYTIFKGGRSVGSIRRAGRNEGWYVNVTGFHFYTTPGQGIARTTGAKETVIKIFPTIKAARTAVKIAFEMHAEVLKG